MNTCLLDVESAGFPGTTPQIGSYCFADNKLLLNECTRVMGIWNHQNLGAGSHMMILL